jgi:hypothetical protein
MRFQEPAFSILIGKSGCIELDHVHSGTRLDEEPELSMLEGIRDVNDTGADARFPDPGDGVHGVPLPLTTVASAVKPVTSACAFCTSRFCCVNLSLILALSSLRHILIGLDQGLLCRDRLLHDALLLLREGGLISKICDGHL